MLFSETYVHQFCYVQKNVMVDPFLGTFKTSKYTKKELRTTSLTSGGL